MNFKMLFLLVPILLGTQAFAVVNPSEVFIDVYAIALSENADCSNPIVVIDNGATAVRYDFTTNPFLGEPSTPIPNGTYRCMVMKMSDVIRFRPATTDGTCTAGTQYTIDVCRTTQGTYTPMTISGTTATFGTAGTDCTGTAGTPADTQVPLFLSTHSSNSDGTGSAFDRPAVAGTNGFYLDGAFEVTGTKTGTFVVNFNSKVDGSGGSCDLQPPVFGFR